MATVTGQAIRERLWRWGLIQLAGVATGGDTSYLTDTARLQSNALSETIYDDCIVRITSGTSAPDGELSYVDYLDTANGRLYVTPSFTGAVASTDTYEIWKAGVDPDDVDRARDEALTAVCSYWNHYPLSVVPNAGYKEALGSSNWEVLLGSGSGAIAKATPSFPSEFFTDSLLCTNTDTADEGAESASIYVQPGQSWFFYVPVSVRSGTAEVIIYDNTNGAEIDLNGTATETLRGWSGIELTFSIPTGCEDITVRLVGQGATDIVEWGPVFMHPQGATVVPLPARVINRNRIGAIYKLRDYAIADQSIYWGEEQMDEVAGVRRQQVGDAVKLRFEEDLEDAPYVFAERTYYAALQTAYRNRANRTGGDLATTTCPIDYVVPALVRILAEQYMEKQPSQRDFWVNLWHRAMRELGVMERDFGPEPQAVQERGRVIYIPHVRV